MPLSDLVCGRKCGGTGRPKDEASPTLPRPPCRAEWGHPGPVRLGVSPHRQCTPNAGKQVDSEWLVKRAYKSPTQWGHTYEQGLQTGALMFQDREKDMDSPVRISNGTLLGTTRSAVVMVDRLL